MKKLFFLLAACLFILPSCEPDPVLSLDKSSIEFSENRQPDCSHHGQQ